MADQFTYPSSTRPCTYNPILHTRRLTITVLDLESPSSVSAVLDIFNDPDTTSQTGHRHPIDTPEKLQAVSISTCLLPKYTPFQLPISGPAIWIVRLGVNSPSGTPIGMINICNRDPDLPPDIGWVILTAHRQQGFASEAAQRVLNYFTYEFQDLGFNGADPPIGMIATLDLTNTASANVARRLGFVDLGDARKDSDPDAVLTVYGTPSLLLADGEKPFSKDRHTISRFGKGEMGRRTAELVFGKKGVA